MHKGLTTTQPPDLLLATPPSPAPHQTYPLRLTLPCSRRTAWRENVACFSSSLSQKIPFQPNKTTYTNNTVPCCVVPSHPPRAAQIQTYTD